MSLKVTFTHPDFPKGYEFEVAGLGLLKNGEATSVSAEQEAQFVAEHGEGVKDHLKEDEMFKVEGTTEVKGGDS